MSWFINKGTVFVSSVKNLPWMYFAGQILKSPSSSSQASSLHWFINKLRIDSRSFFREKEHFIYICRTHNGSHLLGISGDSSRAGGNGMELWQGRGSWGSGKGAAPEGSGRAIGCTGQWVRPWAAGVQGAFGQHSECRVWTLGGVVWRQKLASMILMGPFQPGIFYSSMCLWLPQPHSWHG